MNIYRKKLLVTSGLVLLIFISTAQKTKIYINKNGKIVNTTTINNYNAKTKEAILNVSKYIDTAKQIFIVAGSVTIGMVTLSQLQAGHTFSPFGISSIPAGIYLRGGDMILKLKLIKGKLKISCDINGFDEKYIARINDNKLICSKQDYHLYVSDRYFELFDDYYIPVLQIELLKNANAIYIGGAINYSDGYTIISQSGVVNRNFPKQKLLIPQQQRDSLFNEYLIEAKRIKPIHE
jgi:hypothetical protein